MTLIAAFEVQNTPVLIGDLMLSRTGVVRKHSRLPTIDDISSILDIEWQRIVSGTNRKVYIVHPKVAIGWAGSLFCARKVITQLKKLLKGNDEIDKTLISSVFQQCQEVIIDYTKSSTIDPNDLVIIGWVILQNSESVKFEWTCESFEFFDSESLVARGSDTSDMEDILKDHKYVVKRGKDSIYGSITSVAADCVGITSVLLGNEITTGSNIPLLYGGGYEIIISFNGAFHFLDNILYLPIFLHEDKQSKNTVFLMRKGQILFKYYYLEDNLVIAREVRKPDRNGVLEKIEVTISAIQNFDVDSESLMKLNYESGYKIEPAFVSCIFICNVKDHYLYFPISFHYINGNEFVKFQDNNILLSKKLLETVLPDLKQFKSQFESANPQI